MGSCVPLIFGDHVTSFPIRVGEWLTSWAPSKRSVLAASAGASLGVVTLAGASIAMSHVSVTLEVDGVYQPYSGFASTVDELLSAAQVPLHSADLVSPARHQSVNDGDHIVVRHAQPLDVVIDGRATTLMTTANSVSDALSALSARGNVSAAASRSAERELLLPLLSAPQEVPVKLGDRSLSVLLRPGDDIRQRIVEAGIPLSALDRVKAHFEAGTLHIDIVPVTRGIVVVPEKLPFSERSVESAELFRGESVVTTRGVEGVKNQTLWQETVGGQVAHSVTLSEVVASEPQEQVRSHGTKEVSPMELIKAGIDPRAQLEDGTEPDGTTSKRYRAALGSLSSDEEITAIRAEARLQGIPLVYSGEDPRSIARPLVAERGWGDGEFRCLVSLWDRESHWNPYAENASSGAYGIPQSLPGNKMASAGDDWRTNPATQIKWGLGYIAGRYGTPCAAWGHSEAKGWY